MTSSLTRALLTLPLLLLTACGAAVGTQSSLATTPGGLYVAQFSPASGAYGAMPTTVTLGFSSIDVNAVQGGLVSNYQMSCAGNVGVNATSASYATGWVTLTFAPQTAPNGSVCVLNISSNIYDAEGEALIASSATYTISSGGSFTWSESGSTGLTGTVGGTGGTGYNEQGADGTALSGFNVDLGSYVNGIQGVWTSNAGTISTGSDHGSSPAATSLACPANTRMTGIFGYYTAGAYVNSIGFICKDAAQASSTTIALTGPASGTSFAINCPSGQFATGMYGNSGLYVDSIGLGCR